MPALGLRWRWPWRRRPGGGAAVAGAGGVPVAPARDGTDPASPTTAADPDPADAEEPPVRAAVDGGRLRILPGSPRRPALLQPGRGVLLRVNGVPVARAAAVTPDDAVEVELLEAAEDPAPAQAVQVTVSRDRLQASAWLVPVRRRVLRDVPPARVVRLDVEEQVLPPPGVSPQAVRQALAAAGVCQGIDEEAIALLLASPPGTPVVVARARLPEPSRDGTVEPLVEVHRRPRRVRGDRVDHRERYALPQVAAGDPVARLVPPVPGADGVDVTGRPLSAAPARPARVQAGEGVVARPDPDGGATFFALREGRPVVERLAGLDWRVDVVPLLVHRGDVDVASGNLRFRGDVLIQGNVREGARVVAAGHVWVEGNVDGASIQADGDIQVAGGVFRSQLVAGARSLLYAQLADALPPLAEGVRQLVQAMAIVRQAASFRSEDLARLGPGRLVRLLVELKFRDLPARAARVHELWAGYEGDLGPPLEEVREAVAALAAGRIDDRFDAVALAERLEEALPAVVAGGHRPAGRVGAEYVHNAVVRAGEAVAVGSRGTYHARIVAGERVEVSGPVVGGALEAGRLVRVLEAGTEAAPTTLLAVGADGAIVVGRAYPNVWLRLGGRAHRLERGYRRLRATASRLGGVPV